MLQQALSKTMSLSLAALMTLVTLGAIDQLAMPEAQAQRLAAQASKLLKPAAATLPTQNADRS